MSERPLVTIAIPAFNAERWIHRCIESALAQTHKQIEVRVLDDGSTDATVDIAKEFGTAIHLDTRENRGSNPTRNELLSQAQGDWIQFLDADDWLLPSKIESNLKAASSGRFDGVYGPILEDDGETRNETSFDESDDLFVRWIRWQFCQTGGLLWRTEALKRIEGWNDDYPCCQDNELCGRALRSGLRFAFDPAPGAVYRLVEESLSRGRPERVTRLKMKLQREMLVWLDESGTVKDAHREATGQALFESLRMLALHDLDEACIMERSLRGENALLLQGPAAPGLYRLLYRTGGFRIAEMMASFRRKRS